jgi:hypothetical protein
LAPPDRIGGQTARNAAGIGGCEILALAGCATPPMKRAE